MRGLFFWLSAIVFVSACWRDFDEATPCGADGESCGEGLGVCVDGTCCGGCFNGAACVPIAEQSNGECGNRGLACDACELPQQCGVSGACQLPKPATEVLATAFSACGRDPAGEVYCRRPSTDDYVDMGPLHSLKATRASTSTGIELYCGISPDAELRCRGNTILVDEAGEYAGLGGTEVMQGPVTIETDVTLYALSRNAICVLRGNTERCHRQGEAPIERTDLALPEDIVDYQQGSRFSYVRTASGDVFSWDTGETGPIEALGRMGVSRDVGRVQGEYEDLSVGRNSACGIRNQDGVRSVWCWGVERSGDLAGLGTTQVPQLVPFEVLPEGFSLGEGVVLAHGQSGTCLLHAGALVCWGSAIALGQESENSVLPPMRIARLTRLSDIAERVLPPFVHVSRSTRGTCAAAEEGTIWCWGVNGFAQSSDGPFALPE